jgi:hypothetical protein
MKLSYFSLILLLCATISVVLSQPSREINKTLPLKSSGRVAIDTYKGSITITTHNKPQVEVNVKIEPDDSDSWNGGQDVDDTEIRIDGGEDEVTIYTDYKKVKRHHHKDFWDWFADPFESSYSLPFVHYTIKMPSTAGLRIKDYKSRTRIENIRTELKFSTYKGIVDIDNLFGGIDLETYKGEVRVSFSKINNDSRFETYKGSITVEIPRGDGFELRTDFERRVDFTSDFDVTDIERGRKHRSHDYRGKNNSGGPTLELESEKGEFRLKAR